MGAVTSNRGGRNTPGGSANPSPRWAFFRPTVIPDIETPDPYLTRLRIVQTPWFGVYLHQIHRADGAREVHDHPWSFVSIILHGAYVEHREPSQATKHDATLPIDRRLGLRWFGRGYVNFLRAEDAHRIAHVAPDTWTLVLVGRRRRDWGFHTPDGWVHHKTWIDEHFPARHDGGFNS